MTLRKARVTIAGIVLACGLAAFAALPASADITTYTLTTGNAALSGYTGPFGTVQVDRTDSTHATITFTADSDFAFVDSSIVGVNVNASAFSISGLTGVAVDKGPDLSNTGPGNVDGFGMFNQTFSEKDSFSWRLSSVSFTVTNTVTGGTWATANDVLVINNTKNNALAAAHVGAYSDDGKTFDATGYAAAGEPGIPPSAVPEASTLALLGFGGLPLLALRRRRG